MYMKNIVGLIGFTLIILTRSFATNGGNNMQALSLDVMFDIGGKVQGVLPFKFEINNTSTTPKEIIWRDGSSNVNLYLISTDNLKIYRCKSAILISVIDEKEIKIISKYTFEEDFFVDVPQGEYFLFSTLMEDEGVFSNLKKITIKKSLTKVTIPRK